MAKWTKSQVRIWEDGFLMGILWAVEQSRHCMVDELSADPLPGAAAREWMKANKVDIDTMRTSCEDDTAGCLGEAVPPGPRTKADAPFDIDSSRASL